MIRNASLKYHFQGSLLLILDQVHGEMQNPNQLLLCFLTSKKVKILCYGTLKNIPRAFPPMEDFWIETLPSENILKVNLIIS